MTLLVLTVEDVQFLAGSTAATYGETVRDIERRHERACLLYGVPRGGVAAAAFVQAALIARGNSALLVDHPEDADIIVDDIVDSGATKARYQYQFPLKPFIALYHKQDKTQWVVFPWEQQTTGGADDVPTRLLQYIGEDPSREGLQETPQRFLAAWREFTVGYSMGSVLKTFDDGAERCNDETVLVANLQVWSKCEHHLSDIFGVAHIGYIPRGKIVGLSKFQRLVTKYARRLQVQERLTNQIVDEIQKELDPIAVGAVLECRHLCMESRGVSTRGALTVTCALRGAYRDETPARAEFLSLVRGASKGVTV